MLIIGLTGSIGMGKTATANIFRAEGVPVFDADAAVHALYSGPDAEKIDAAFPGTLVSGKIDREKLSARVVGNPDAMRRLEHIVHPLVRAAEDEFLRKADEAGNRIAVLDIPLLLETGAEGRCDIVVVVSAPQEIQRKRVLERPGMTAEKFEAILAKQMPDEEKRRHAHTVIPTGKGFPVAEKAVRDLLRAVDSMPGQVYANRGLAR
ncbi:MAG: dephospho-CoA kinase [Rhodobiaceae bacterium]|nr:dephospho-CoA kinase [Rhodobiaceae bacterium]MCC0049280.1 dephospho-CoA kinase [Rhodobiaceae bacterium]